MLSLNALTIALLPLLQCTSALDSSSMRARTVYQLVTDRFALSSGSTTAACSVANRQYCGGTWSGLSSKLAYIQGMGFDTIWISPVVDNIGGTTGEGQAYHGYWTLDPSQLNANFGAATDLKNLVSAVHAKGMYIMVDVVINHVAATSNANFQTSSAYGPFNVQSDFHPFCWISDYSNQTNVEQCWLGDTSVALPDLNTESTTVSDYWTSWVKSLVGNYTFDAVRIDTVKHIRQDFWPGFTSAAGVFNQGEVLDGDPGYVGPYQTAGSINPFNYPIYYPLTRAFNGTGDLSDLVNMTTWVKSQVTDATLLGSFLNNHDNPRFESYTSDPAVSSCPGIHADESSLETPTPTCSAQTGSRTRTTAPSEWPPFKKRKLRCRAGFTGGNDPSNREPLWPSGYNTTSSMYTFFTNMNAARKAAGTASSSFYTSAMAITQATQNEIVIAKPPLISVLSNRGSGAADQSVPVNGTTSGWGANVNVTDAVSCQTFVTNSAGNLQVCPVCAARNS